MYRFYNVYNMLPNKEKLVNKIPLNYSYERNAEPEFLSFCLYSDYAEMGDQWNRSGKVLFV